MGTLPSTHEIAPRLAAVVGSGGVEVHMQPVVSLPSLHVQGCEALARWTDPELGEVPPDRFIPLAEDSGLIVELGRQVLRQACSIATTWQHLPGGRMVSVNVSAVQLAEPGFTQEVARALADSGLAPDRLLLELTETALLHDPDSAAVQLRQLRTMGVQIALDDFGVGHSPLTLLRRLPFNVVKIERTFVANVHDRAHDAVAARIVIEAAHSLGLRVCAEGIELRDQAQQLVSMGCDLAQGFLMARPYDPSSGAAPDDAVQAMAPIDPLALSPIPLGGTDELVVVTDPEHRITYASIGSLHLLGYRPIELLGTYGPSYLHEDERAAVLASTDPGLLDLRGVRQHRLRHRDGSWRWFRTRFQALTNVDGSLREAISTSKDITAEVEAEQQRAAMESQFRWAFDGAPIGMAMSTFEGQILRVNDAFAGMVGWSSADLVGKNIAEITHPDDSARDAENLGALRRSGGTRQVHKRYLHRDGHTVRATVWVAAMPPRGQTPGVLLAHIMSRDETPVRLAGPDRA